jgi:hypothetical protein
MALDGTYAGLKASIADFLNRTDLTEAIPDFIVLAEAQMARRFVSRARDGMPIPRRLVQRVDVSLTQGTEYFPVPDDFQGSLELILQSDPIIELAFLETSALQREKKRALWTGAPRWYGVVGGQFQLYPVADQAYSAEQTYIGRALALSDANPGNWVLSDYPDAYLYGALTAAAPYLKDDDRVTMWGTLFSTAVDDICNADPMPTDKSLLRSDVPRGRHRGGWNIQSDC